MPCKDKRSSPHKQDIVPQRTPVVHTIGPGEVYMELTRCGRAYIEGVRDTFRCMQESRKQRRHRPKSDPAIDILQHIYRSHNGKPSRNEVSDFELEKAYQDECEKRGIPKAARAKRTQLLRCAGRKTT